MKPLLDFCDLPAAFSTLLAAFIAGAPSLGKRDVKAYVQHRFG
jgi:hypothetical protein